MSSRPTVSVLLPVHNGGEHLYDAVASLVSQTFEDFEIVVVDDGSTDDSATRLEAWCRADRRVRLLRLTFIPCICLFMFLKSARSIIGLMLPVLSICCGQVL